MLISVFIVQRYPVKPGSLSQSQYSKVLFLPNTRIPDTAVKETELVAPLRKQKKDGTPYGRPDRVETKLTALYEVPIAEVARRLEITDRDASEHVPTECILHFLRRMDAEADYGPFEKLFQELRRRVSKAVRVGQRRGAAPTAAAGIAGFDLELQDYVLDELMKLLCADRVEYCERLDFFEAQFNSALSKLRVDGQRRVLPRANSQESLELADEVPKAIDEALHRMRENEDENYRLRLLAAINTLPPDYRRVIQLLLKGYTQIEAAKVLGCTDKTLRKRRDEAVQIVLKSLEEETGR
ncbi:sigma factor-like helix-turn-helix DNA-binding protein [Anatilimnocola floriformis]|uniref:sigma factor-like helix-turn-helix DNA-binding protein n=1 Tax=Anatilimnocola floriformis TaxID=2948575 RepID=UPI0020C282DB|nr:sigma factor-like helix-turn-helix DNA-binding protein [Anatilimnocola floriformis]